MRVMVSEERPDSPAFEIDLPGAPRIGDHLMVEEGGQKPAVYRVDNVIWSPTTDAVVVMVAKENPWA